MKRHLSFVFALVLLAWIAPRAVLASDGDLVKTAGASAVYYRGADGKRYVFPNSATYFTWYADFSAVKTISASDLAALRIGGNATYRPGTRLLKVTSAPDVYAVSRDGLLRRVASEAVAACLYGSDWSKMVDDLPDVFFTDYRIGEPVETCADFDRSAESAAAVSIGVDKDLPPPAVPMPSVPTFSLSPGVTAAAAGKEVTLIEIRLRTPVDVTLRKLPVRLQALAGNPGGGTSDDDPGGLVRGHSGRANFTHLRLVIEDGPQVFERQELSTQPIDDQDQTVLFSGSLPLAAGSQTDFLLEADVDQDAPVGERYLPSLVLPRDALEDALGGAVAFEPKSQGIVAAPITIGKAEFEATAIPLTAPTIHVRGEKNATLGAFEFHASVASDTVVRAAAFQAYVDEQEAASGFLPGGDADNGTETRARDLVKSLTLVDEHGQVAAGPVEVPFSGRVEFSGASILIPAGTSRKFYLKGDLDKDADIEAHDDLLAFDIADAAHDIDAVDPSGAKIAATGSQPNGGTSPLYEATVKAHGTLTFAWSGNATPAVAGREERLGTLRLSAKDGGFEVPLLTFSSVAETRKTLASLRLAYVDAAGAARSAAAEFTGNDATFHDLAVSVPRDASVDLQVFGELNRSDRGASESERIQVVLSDHALTFRSPEEDRVFGERDLASVGASRIASDVMSDRIVRLTSLRFERAADSPSGTVPRGGAVETLRFIVTAGPEGSAHIRRLAFDITPSDRGTEGAGNDALERWAAVNGDFADDNGVAALRQITDAGSEDLGLGADASFRYSIIRAGLRDDAPSHIVSTQWDHGLIVIDFADAAQPLIPAGTSVEFALDLKTDSLASGVDRTLAVRLLDGPDFRWSGASPQWQPALDGYETAGLPIDTSVKVH